VKNLSGAPLKGRLLALPTNIRLGWRGLPQTNTPAYYSRKKFLKYVVRLNPFNNDLKDVKENSQ